jgi:DNA-directed RNA polymerase subunit beta'
VLVEGKADPGAPARLPRVQRDFDGDQMAVHLPLSAEAQAEARS